MGNFGFFQLISVLVFGVLISNGKTERTSIYVIKNIETGKVLYVADNVVKLQNFTKVVSQLWHLELVDAGKFVILNRKNNRAVDVEFGVGRGNRIITWPKHGLQNQRWFIESDGTVVSDGKDEQGTRLVITVNKDEEVTAEVKCSKHNQKFAFYDLTVQERVPWYWIK